MDDLFWCGKHVFVHFMGAIQEDCKYTYNIYMQTVMSILGLW